MGLEFDPTILFGGVIGAVSIVVAVIAAATNVRAQVNTALEAMRSIDRRITNIEEKFNHVDAKIGDMAALQQRISDGKDRMDAFDHRLIDIERALRTKETR